MCSWLLHAQQKDKLNLREYINRGLVFRKVAVAGVGAIFSKREAVVACMTLVSVAALLAFFPAQPTGMMSAHSTEKTQADAEPASQQSARISYSDAMQPVSFSAYDLEECRSELAVYKKSVKELVSIVEEKCEMPYRDFERTALEVAKSNTYSEGHFNCFDFSSRLVSRLEGIGYGARIVNGYYKGEPHAWVVAEIPIEATSGNLITPQSYADYAPENNT